MKDVIFNFLEHKNHTILGLLFGFFLILLSLESLQSLFEKAFGKYWYFAYFIPLTIWFLIWFLYRYRLPRIKKNKLGICLFVYTENKIDRFKLKKDFVASLEKRLADNNLLKLTCFVVAKNHFSKKIQEINDDDKKIELIKKWNKKIGANFLIWGGVKKRKEGENKFFLELDSMVYHRPIAKLENQQEFKRDMLCIFPKRISFYERFELRGFEVSAELISIALQYIVGAAFFLSYNPFLALKLHKGFLSSLDKIEDLPSNFEFIKKRARKMISVENLILARYYYESKKDLNKTFKHTVEALDFDKENYQAYLLLAICHFLKNRDIKNSFKAIRSASKYSEGDSSWRYSEAFLYCYTGELNNAIDSYEKAFKGKILKEKGGLKGITSFIKNILRKEPNKKQLYFALGKIYYQKLDNMPEALESFEKFLESEPTNQRFFKATRLTKIYLRNIKKEMGLSKP